MKNFAIRKVAAAAVLLLSAAASHASLILVAPETFGGSGLGAVNTILTVQGKNSTTESGGVSYSAAGDVISGGDTKKGNSQTQTRSLGELGITSGSSLRIVFNATENDNLISLTGLTLNIYDLSGTSLFTASLDQAYNDLAVQSGIGNSGFVFGLNTDEALEAQQKVFNAVGYQNFRLGLSAIATGFSGGSETFFATESQLDTGGGGADGTVPEPGTLALLGLALGGFTLARRKRA